MNKSFLTLEDAKISNEFKRNGYVIRNIADKEALDYIQSKFVKLIKKNYKFEKSYSNEKIFNLILNKKMSSMLEHEKTK